MFSMLLYIIENIPNQIRYGHNENNRIFIHGLLDDNQTKEINRLFHKYNNTIQVYSIKRTLGGRNGKSYSIQQNEPELYNYYSTTLKSIVSSKLGEGCGGELITANERDKSRCMVITYDRPIDRIGYHYDNNYYTNCTFLTVLLPLYVEPNTSLYTYMDKNVEKTVNLKVGEILIFEGDKIYHKASINMTYNKRIVLSAIYLIPNKGSNTITQSNTYMIVKNLMFL